MTQLALGTSVPSHFHAAFLDERAEVSRRRGVGQPRRGRRKRSGGAGARRPWEGTWGRRGGSGAGRGRDAHARPDACVSMLQLVDALNTYLALPEWPEIREELLKRGPRLLARAKEPTHSAPDATAPVVGIKRHDQLHLAQVHTFANINRGLSPEDQGFMRPILGSQHGSQERSLDGAS